jgi:8-oxo-dGTP pyrophosphatase MutT (NUDIX family)
MGASILPMTIINNKVYFLFGKEREIDENPGWSDFGGGTEQGETFVETAIREGSEELTGFLGSSQDIKKILNKYGTYKIDFHSKGHTTYRVHIFPIKYDPMFTFYYNNNQKFLQTKLDPKIIQNTKIFEKTEIKWFNFQELKKNIKQFRSFYQNIVKLILDNQYNINKFIRNKNTNSKTKTKTKIIKTNKSKSKTRKN